MRLNETKRKQRTSQEEVLAELFAEAELQGSVRKKKNWDAWMESEVEQQIDEDIRYVGIRAHDFEPIWLADGEQPEEGWIKVKVDSVAKLPFEHKYFLKESEEQEDVCWFVQRDLWDVLEKKGMPGWLKIPEEKLLLLK